MLDLLLNIPQQPVMYHVALLILLILFAESAARLRQLRWVVSGIIYLTVGLWYFIDPVYRLDDYQKYSSDDLNTVFLQVSIFLFSFRLLVGQVALATRSRVLTAFGQGQLNNKTLLRAVMLSWLLLFAIGMYRADFRFFETLFPLENRWQQVQMWGRGRFGGATDFLVSIGSYCYLMVCAMFGLLAVATEKTSTRMQMLALIAITWPMFALSGTRNQFLIVAMPAVLAVLLLKNWSRIQKILFVIGCFLLINTIFLIVITHRDRGILYAIERGSFENAIEDAKHLGLNMPEEMLYINRYQEQGLLTPEWGYEYFAHAVNFIPRPIWPGKPFPGERFAALRVGYHRGQVAATISNGLIGQGVQNFGKWLGPMAPAILMGLLVSLICRLPRSGDPFLRSCLVIFLMALIPN
ncbi:MAG: O-antigen polymerase, partial [Planctomyces sp.]